MRVLNQRVLAWESLVVAAFLAGLWLSIGYSPIQIIALAFAEVADSIAPGWGIVILAIPIVGLIWLPVYALAKHGGSGLVAVGAGFASGALVVTSSLGCVLLLAVAFVLGVAASSESS